MENMIELGILAMVHPELDIFFGNGTLHVQTHEYDLGEMQA